MFHSSSYTDSSLQHFQQTPVYVPTSRGMAGAGYGTAGGGSHYQPQTGGWAHPAADPAGYGSTHGLSAAAAAHPGAITAAAAAGQFYAQNVMMGGWRAYDSSGFQRTSPYGKSNFFFQLLDKYSGLWQSGSATVFQRSGFDHNLQ